MSRRRFWLLWLPVGALALVVAAVVVVLTSPGLLRRAAVAEVRSITGRETTIDSLTFEPWTGRIALRGLTVMDTDGAPLATIDRVDARLRRRALLRGHIWLTSLAIERSTVRVVRDSHGEFNLSTLIRRGQRGRPSPFDITVDEFALREGTVLLEDRALSPWQTWRSENLAIQARNVSTRRDDGTADATSTINGAPVSVHIEQLRLEPVHLRAVVRAREVDVALARVYLPHDAPVTLQKGRAEVTVTAALDARQGLRLDADATVADAVAIRRYQRDPFFVAPAIRLSLRDLTVAEGGLALARAEVSGSGTVQHGDVQPPARFVLDRFSASAEALTWPVRAPARVALVSTVPGGGELRADGVVRLRPTVADLDVRLSGLNLEPWARYVSPAAKMTGTGQARLAVRASFEHGVTAQARGAASVDRVVVTEGARRLLAVDRAEVTGIDAGWPARVTIDRVRLRRPTATLERDASGVIALPTRPARARADTPPAAGDDTPPPPPAPSTVPVAVREVVVDDGALTWRDAAVRPAAALAFHAIQLTAQDVTWPLEHPAEFRLTLRPAGAGTLAVNGKASLQPLAADVGIRARGVDVAPYRPYLPIAANVGGVVSATVEASVSRTPVLAARVRGDVALSRAFLADGPRRIASVQRASARGVDVDWPARVAADQVTLRQPWVLVERDERGGFPLRTLLASARGEPGPDASAAAPSAGGNDETRALRLRRLVIEDGGARFVDHSVTPAYAEDLSRAWGQVSGLGSAPAPPAELELRAVLGPSAAVSIRGRAGPIGAPLFVDATAELREFSIPRVNPYLARFTAWTAQAGRLTTTVHCRIRGDELEVRDELHLARLEVLHSAPEDPAAGKLGLPLGLVIRLLKDRKGNIALSVPIGGRLGDPKFELHDAIWSAVRAITIKTIALPVSWIGRLRFTADSKVQDIEIDPVPFPAGTAELTREATDRLGRVAAFLHTLPEARMILTPAVSLGDVEALKAEHVQARIAELAKTQRLDERDAAIRLFNERYPGRTPPENPDVVVRLLREVEPPPDDEAYRLAKRRADTVRDVLKKADVDGQRLQINKEPAALDTFDAGRVEFGLADQLKPRRTLADLLRALVEAFTRRVATLAR